MAGIEMRCDLVIKCACGEELNVTEVYKNAETVTAEVESCDNCVNRGFNRGKRDPSVSSI